MSFAVCERSNMRLPSGGAVRLVRGARRSAAYLSAGAAEEGKQASNVECDGCRLGEGVGLHRTVGSVGMNGREGGRGGGRESRVAITCQVLLGS